MGLFCSSMDEKGRSFKKNNMEDEMDLKRGPWTAEEDFKLTDYIATHGEGRWNSLSRCAGMIHFMYTYNIYIYIYICMFYFYAHLFG